MISGNNSLSNIDPIVLAYTYKKTATKTKISYSKAKGLSHFNHKDLIAAYKKSTVKEVILEESVSANLIKSIFLPKDSLVQQVFLLFEDGWINYTCKVK